jgi:predicted ATP-dependent endonuclease of OLD family
LSGDGITALAGQNEAGKTAVLTALRDFDREKGAAPLTKNYIPEERSNSDTRVSVEFGDIEIVQILTDLEEEKLGIPTEVVEQLKQSRTIWITCHFESGRFL